jgi:polar amino acid transport system substrate-binding protein
MNSRRIWKAVGGLLMAAIFMVACAAPTATPAVPQATQTPQIIQQTVQVEVTRVVQVEGPTQTPVPPVATAAPVEEPIRLISPGKLTVGIFPAPGADEIIDGKITGVEGLLIAEIAKRLNLQPEYQPYDKPSAIAALLSGRVDVLAAGLSVQPPRAQVVYFAEPWLLQAEGISVLPGTEIHSWEEAAAKKETLATVTGYSYIPYWEQLGVNIHTFDSIDACFLDVINKGATGCAVGTFDLMYRKATAPESAISKLVAQPVSGPSIFADLNSLAVAKDNPALARKVSQLMVDLWRDGTVEKDYRQIFGNTEIELFINPPKGSALYYPGPWEADIVAPASPVYPAVTTLAPGQLTVGILSNSNLLKLDGANMSGPEAKILQFAAEKLG